MHTTADGQYGVRLEASVHRQIDLKTSLSAIILIPFYV
jgi:hypothetical protein